MQFLVVLVLNSFLGTIACPYRKSNPDVLMVQSAQDRQAENAANSLNTARNRRILAQRQVCARLVVISLIRFEEVAKVPLAKHDDEVQALPVCAENLVRLNW